VGACVGAAYALLGMVGGLLTQPLTLSPGSNPLLVVLGALLFACPLGAIPGLFAGFVAGPFIGAATALLIQKRLLHSLVGLTLGAAARWSLETGTRATVASGVQSTFEVMGGVTGAIAGLLTAAVAARFLSDVAPERPSPDALAASDASIRRADGEDLQASHSED